jgi:hypothetical protein
MNEWIDQRFVETVKQAAGDNLKEWQREISQFASQTVAEDPTYDYDQAYAIGIQVVYSRHTGL